MRDFDRTIAINAVVGSHNYNLDTEHSDVDRKVFVVPSFQDLYDGTRFTDSAQSETEDFTAQDVRQLPEQWWKSNINFLEVMYSTSAEIDPAFQPILDQRERWARMNLWQFFQSTHGMHRAKMHGLYKGTGTTQILVDTYGHDTKQAHHAMRCLFTLRRFINNGGNMQMAFWYNDDDPEREVLLAIKNHQYTEEQFLDMVHVWHDKNYEDTRAFYMCYAGHGDERALAELNQMVFEYVRGHISPTAIGPACC